ncbi:MAG: hypothetical protein JWN64_82 [Parcubacteria group bacterium]|nr:hypothetical protein [Parcubacteria group bacterium]
MDSVSTSTIPGIQVPSLVGAINFHKVVPVLFTLLFILWVIYTLVAAYHWFRYGHRSAIAIPALAVHVAVSAVFALYAASGLH